MLTAPVVTLDLHPVQRNTRWAPLVLSLVVHLLLALAWLSFPMPELQQDEEPTITVEIAPQPPQPEPPKLKPADTPVGADQPAPPAPKAIPQLEDGLLDKKSSPAKAKAESAAPSPRTEPRTEAVLKPKKPEPVTQNDRDFVLSQVIRHWHPPRELAAYDRADVQVGVIVDANGYFDGDYDARRPWNPAAVFDGYNSLSPKSVQRRSVDAFYQAIRKAQPVRLPPALKAKAPFPVRLDFRFKDAR